MIFLTLYLEIGDKPPVPGINPVRKLTRGIKPRVSKIWDNPVASHRVFSNGIKDDKEGLEVTIPCDSFNIEKDAIYYKDNEGTYKLNIGTYQTWQDYLNPEGLFK